jgi:hypothetical protein
MKQGKRRATCHPLSFVVNIILDLPFYPQNLFYYAVEDMSSIDGSSGTGSSRLAKKCLFGDGDEFEIEPSSSFPRLQGNFM